MGIFAVRGVFCLTVLLLASCDAPKPHWQNKNDPLGPAENTLSTIDGTGEAANYAVTIACWGKDKITLAFFTGEKQTFDQRPALSLSASARTYPLQIRTDQNPVAEYTSEAKWSSDWLRYEIYALDALAVAKSLVSAKQRLVVGARATVSNGRNHVAVFTVEGASETITRTLKACGIE